MKYIKNIFKNTFIEKYARIIKSFIPYKYMVDKEFYLFLKTLHDNENKSYDEIIHFQFSKLKEIVKGAYEHSSFYNKKYDEYGFNPCHLKDISDIKKIPLLSKDEVREHSKEMCVVNRAGLYSQYTSGTTGKPLIFFADKKCIAREWASICYQWERVGYKPNDGRIELRGFIDGNNDCDEHPDHKVVRINIIKLSRDNINKIIGIINKSKYRFLHGYPSAIYKFAKILGDKKIDYSPDAIMFASEVLYDWQFETIHDRMKKSLKIAHYGQAEKVALGAWLDNDKKYHFIPSYGITEIDPETGELIGTSLINDVMPFIRYKMTDTVEDLSEKPQTEKTLFPVIGKITGRQEDLTYDQNGNMIPPAIVTFPFKQLKSIKACKIIQNEINDFELIVEGANCSEIIVESNNVINDLKKIYGDGSRFKLIVQNAIPTDKSGKFRWIECKIKV